MLLEEDGPRVVVLDLSHAQDPDDEAEVDEREAGEQEHGEVKAVPGDDTGGEWGHVMNETDREKWIERDRVR